MACHYGVYGCFYRGLRVCRSHCFAIQASTNHHSVFLALGEFGPGDNIGVVAAKTSATAIRGQYYSYAAAIGKIGAFVGTYVLPIAQDNAPNKVRAGQDPFFISSSLCIFSAFLAFFLLPQINQVCSPSCDMLRSALTYYRTPSPARMRGSVSFWPQRATIHRPWVKNNWARPCPCPPAAHIPIRLLTRLSLMAHIFLLYSPRSIHGPVIDYAMI